MATTFSTHRTRRVGKGNTRTLVQRTTLCRVHIYIWSFRRKRALRCARSHDQQHEHKTQTDTSLHVCQLSITTSYLTFCVFPVSGFRAIALHSFQYLHRRRRRHAARRRRCVAVRTGCLVQNIDSRRRWSLWCARKIFRIAPTTTTNKEKHKQVPTEKKNSVGTPE